MKIFINPGHDRDVEPGACYNGLREADIAADIGKMVAEYLIKAGCDVASLQVDDLQGICDAANDWGADLFVSIHCNAHEDPAAHGTETYFYYGSAGGRRLAECIHDQIISSIPITSRGIKTDNFYVLTHTEMPAVLVETAFISSSYDANLLITKQDDFARAIARGVTDFLQNNPLPDTIDKPRCPLCGQSTP